MSVSNSRKDWNNVAPSPTPLTRFLEKADAAVPDADPRAAIHPPNPTGWSLVSADGRATMRLPTRFVVGSEACCDLRLSEQGIATHHAMLTVEDDLAYVTPMSDAPTLLDGDAITGRSRLRRNSALTFGGASFRVQHDGPIEDTDWEAEASEWDADPTTEFEQESEWDADEAESEALETPPASEPVAPPPPPAPKPRATTAPTAEARRAATPHVSPRIERDVRIGQRASRRRRGTGWIVWAIAAGAIAAIYQFVPSDVFEQIGWNPDARPTKVEAVSSAPTQTASLPAPPPAQVQSTEPEQTWISVEPSSPDPGAQRLPTNATPAPDPTTTLLAEAAAFEAKGERVNAAQRYVRVLQVQPGSEIARARLDRIVGGVARDASDMILRQRFDSARRSLDQLEVAIPESRRSVVSKDVRDQWRVVQLLLDADALMQQYRLVGPDDPNAVGLLREALRIDPNNAIADEMLAKAHGLQAERAKQ